MRFAATAALLLAACGSEPLPPENPTAGANEPSMVPARLPARMNFAGRWAVRPDMCEAGWWDFASDQVRTAGELTCLVVTDERTATTATLELSCVGDGAPSQQTWQLAGTAESLAVTRNVGTVELVKCEI